MKKPVVGNCVMGIITMILSHGCGDNFDIADIQNNINQSFGGLTTNDEEPQFGDTSFVELGENSGYSAINPSVLDSTETAADAEIAAAETDIMSEITTNESQRALVYTLRITWGRQPINKTITDKTEWNPTISTECGKLGMRHPIGFERWLQGDRVQRPRSSTKTITITSTTSVAFDGVALGLVIPAADRVGCDLTTAKFRFESSALPNAIDVTLDKLNDFSQVTPGKNAGEKVIILAHRIESRQGNDCEKGFVAGHWQKDSTSTDKKRGIFRGRLTNESNELVGHIRGMYGTPEKGVFQGQQVFFGKTINTAGKFRGLLAGRVNDDGTFSGGWHKKKTFADDALNGKISGPYTEGTTSDPDSGVFEGTYASLACTLATEGQTIEKKMIPRRKTPTN